MSVRESNPSSLRSLQLLNDFAERVVHNGRVTLSSTQFPCQKIQNIVVAPNFLLLTETVHKRTFQPDPAFRRDQELLMTFCSGKVVFFAR